jgi:hypothetical protein
MGHCNLEIDSEEVIYGKGWAAPSSLEEITSGIN